MRSGTCERNGGREGNEGRDGPVCRNSGVILGVADTFLGILEILSGRVLLGV